MERNEKKRREEELSSRFSNKVYWQFQDTRPFGYFAIRHTYTYMNMHTLYCKFYWNIKITTTTTTRHHQYYSDNIKWPVFFFFLSSTSSASAAAALCFGYCLESYTRKIIAYQSLCCNNTAYTENI